MGNSVLANFIWKVAERGLSQIISFVLSLILARLIQPSAYGTLALATIFVSILNVFVDCGLGTALVQQKEADDLDFSSVFYFNLLMCILIYGLVFFCAPLVSRFYGDPELTRVVRGIGLIIPVGGARVIQQAYIERTMQFKKFFLSTLTATVLSGILGLVMAYLGYGVWALVTMYVSSAAIGTAILWGTVKWRPQWRFSLARLKPLLDFGSKVLGSSLVTSLYSNSRQLLVGKFYSPSDLAFYNKGNSLPNSIVPVIQTSVTSVLLPTVSRHQDDLQQVREMTGKAIRALSAALWPMMIGLAACAGVFVPLVMTEKWLPAVPYMRIFCIEAAVWPISSIYINSLRAIGRSGLELKLQMFVRLGGILLLLLAIWFGPFAVAVCALLCSVAELGLLMGVSKGVLQYPIREQAKNILPFAAMAVVMGVAVYCLGKLPLGNLFLLSLQVISGIAVYFTLMLLFKRDMVRQGIAVLRKRKGA